MLTGGLIVLGIVAYLAIVVLAMAPFRLSSRISREEEAEEYRILLQRLQKLHNLNAANDAAGHQESPVRAVKP